MDSAESYRKNCLKLQTELRSIMLPFLHNVLSRTLYVDMVRMEDPRHLR